MRTPRFRDFTLATLLGLTAILSGAVQPVAASTLGTAREHAVGMHGQLTYGPDTCRPGYVWREAIPSDHVCVLPETRDLARYDNSQATARRDPNGPWGSNTCISGYVWREAFHGDLVCVLPETRDQVHYDNSQAAARKY